MTPEQMPLFQKNLAGLIKTTAVCDVKAPFSSYPAMGRIVDKLPEAR
ncbi:MAG: hypothetical protein WBG73_07885 [Coleofasciculaceae cyanobacterium]